MSSPSLTASCWPQAVQQERLTMEEERERARAGLQGEAAEEEQSTTQDISFVLPIALVPPSLYG